MQTVSAGAAPGAGDPAFQGRSLGSALLAAVERAAFERHCFIDGLQVSPAVTGELPEFQLFSIPRK